MKKFFFLSIFLHGLLFFSVNKNKAISLPLTMPSPLVVEFVEAQSLPPAPPVQDVSEQFVEQEKTKSESDSKSRLTSVQNKTVETETLARAKGEFKNEKKIALQTMPKDPNQASLFPDEMDPKIIERSLASEGSQSFDYVEDLTPGLETLLNTRETVFYDYYSELRKKINRSWNPIVKAKLKNIIADEAAYAMARNQVTKCLVRLDKVGRLIDIQIIGKSKLRQLDEAAVEAFRRAGPFPKPPKDMSDTNGRILIRWDFIIDS